MNRREKIRSIQFVFQKILTLLMQYEATDGFNRGPEGVDIHTYLEHQLGQIRVAATALFLGEKELGRKMERVIDEVESVTRSCEMPGVVERWIRLDPNLQYFDCAFDLLDEAPGLYDKISMQLTNFQLRCYPSERVQKERNAYFEAAKRRQERCGRTYSQQRAYQEELCRAARLVFEQDFQADLSV